jgi:hypothetical protein
MIRVNAVPELSPQAAPPHHLLYEEFVRPATTAENILGHDAIKTHHHIATVFGDKLGH